MSLRLAGAAVKTADGCDRARCNCAKARAHAWERRLHSGRLVKLGCSLAITVACAASSVRASAQDVSLFGVEARLGSGIAVGGGQGRAVWTVAPLYVGAQAEVTVRVEDLPTSIYGEVFSEQLDRSSVGGGAGVRLRPGGGHLRASLGVEGVIAPFTLFGVSAGAGYCMRLGKASRVCGDVEGLAFFLGDDLPDDRTAGQLRLVLGVGFDAP